MFRFNFYLVHDVNGCISYYFFNLTNLAYVVSAFASFARWLFPVEVLHLVSVWSMVVFICCEVMRVLCFFFALFRCLFDSVFVSLFVFPRKLTLSVCSGPWQY